MINLLLPPSYQQHYYAQPQPQLYEPLPSPPSLNSTNVVKSTQISQLQKNTTESEKNLQSDQIQNESPLAILSEDDPINSIDPTIQKDATTSSFVQSTESTILTTEKSLEFKPLHKKLSERRKTTQK